jgi:hypothetical protein
MLRFRDSLPLAVLYAATVAVVIFSFLAQIVRGDCPVP